MIPAIDPQIAAFLRERRTASLATVDERGHPHAANVQYVSDDSWQLYWVSKPEAAHSRHVVARPRAAVTIYAHVDTPEQIHGVQLHGEIMAIDVDDEPRVRRLYEAKYPFAADPPYRDAVASQQFYRFTPTWLRWIDNRHAFGFKIERDLR